MGVQVSPSPGKLASNFFRLLGRSLLFVNSCAVIGNDDPIGSAEKTSVPDISSEISRLSEAK